MFIFHHNAKGLLRMRLVFCIKTLINSLYNKYQLSQKGVAVEGKPTINGRIKVYGKGKIIFGSNVRINSGQKYNPIGGSYECIFVLKDGGNIILEDNVGISNSTFVARKEIRIGKDTLIGGNCKIYDNDFHSTDYENRMMKIDPDIKVAPIKIGEGAFIGAHTVVLKGSNVGDKTVIGAGSVVSRSIPANEIWAGNPVRMLKKVD